MFNLSLALEDSAKRYSNKTALVFNDTRISYAQLNGAVNQIANGLKDLGIGHGDKVALSCLNLPYFPMVYYGILKVGATVVPLSVLLKKEEVAYHLTDSDAKAYFCFEGNAVLPMGEEGWEGFQKSPTCEHFITITADPAAPSPFGNELTLGRLMHGRSPQLNYFRTSAEDTAVIIYTSGTTGRPKGAELTHSNLAWNADLCRHLFGFREDDITLTVLPMFHIFGQTCLMNASIMHGITNVLVPRFDAEAVLASIQKEGVSIFAGVPTMYWGLANFSPAEGSVDLEKILSRLRMCVSGGASLPIQVMKDFEAKYGLPIYEGYGMSEGSPVVTFNHPGMERKAGSIGVPVWGVEVMIADDNDEPLPVGEPGQLLYRGHNVMKGYYNKPEANAETLKGGWLHSGDVAYKDADGYYFIVDRTKDMIIRGGLNVYPREVEELMLEHDAVSLVAVIGVPDDKLGEEIKACVVLKEGKTVEADALIEWTKARIAAYKYPRIVEFRSSLPMNATGKILKRELRNG
ncbi:MAG: long-chain fatty acid--CoA ligase [Saprospiraceae bacterium]|nr:long-chain fatty acid--CoA ligase [Saprospiraceae bacterium]